MDNGDGEEHSWNEQEDGVAIGRGGVMACAINGQRQSDTV